MSNQKILFIVEGKKTEPQLINYIAQSISLQEHQIFSYETNIHELYKKLITEFDELSEIDIYSFLKELEESRNILPEESRLTYDRKEISEIYLLFDLDAHHNISPNNSIDDNLRNIHNMISTFNDETGIGKLYISYPMVEALKLYKEVTGNIEIHLFNPESNRNSRGQKFKSIANNVWNNNYLQQNNMTEWFKIYHLVLVMYMLNLTDGAFTNYRENVSVESIFNCQKDKNTTQNRVFVFSGVIDFVLDYLGEEDFPKLDGLSTENITEIDLY